MPRLDTYMEADAQTLLSDLQFILARILWAPHCDRDRALELAELASRTHPDPDQRAAIAAWLERHQPAARVRMIDELAVAQPRRRLHGPLGAH